jgi:hypothetical protein
MVRAVQRLLNWETMLRKSGTGGGSTEWGSRDVVVRLWSVCSPRKTGRFPWFFRVFFALSAAFARQWPERGFFAWANSAANRLVSHFVVICPRKAFFRLPPRTAHKAPRTADAILRDWSLTGRLL